MQRIGNTSRKFSGRGKYYHRHAEGHDSSPASVDWREHQKRMGRQKIRRIFRILGLVLLVAAFIAGAVYLV